ncbi:MAG: Flp pilus assembly complex ATPase component TadA [Candidatus Hydrogenedentes bacterium]|nr:Flp pilus assembly complex ATPase component TadA [Candidatus Hydrogenedentota bacterium]
MKIRLGELLINAGLLTEEQLKIGLAAQKKNKTRLGEELVKLGFVTEEQLYESLANQMGLPFVDLDTIAIDPSVVKLIPQKFAEKARILPIELNEGRLTIAMADPTDVIAIDDVRVRTGYLIRTVISTESSIIEHLQKYYHLDQAIYEVMQEVSDDHDEIEFVVEETDETGESDLSDSAPIIKLVNMLLTDAIRSGASDIHIEPCETNMLIRYRVDGILQEKMTIPKHMQALVTSRVKIISDMDIAERRRPQDGRAKIRVGSNEVDLRVSDLPTMFGEKIVIRILDKSQGNVSLDAAGFSKHNYTLIRRLVQQPQGIVLVTGPTGSGKTSTLYACLNELVKPTVNVITVEDPVEFALPGVNQVQVNEKAGLTFANALRSILRQDPNIVMVGEMRDLETAEIGFQASLTGHLVLTTLHTNDAPSALTRLIDLGVQRYLVASTVVGIVAQRLARVICPKCKKETEPTEAEQVILDPARHGNMKFYRGTGCRACNNTGYRGRTPIAEVLVMDSRMKEEVLSGGNERAIQKAAIRNGMLTMRDDGMDKVRQGITTLEEVMRLTFSAEEASLKCPRCQSRIEQEFEICPACGQDLMPDRCENCGNILQPEWTMCPFCRTKRSADAVS